MAPNLFQKQCRAIITKADLGPDDQLLETGCGWGGFAIEAANKTGCRVTGITVSRRQYDYARQRVTACGLDDRVDIQFCDYRRIRGRYDRIVSIEMLDGVGHAYLGTFFNCCDRLLKKGVGLSSRRSPYRTSTMATTGARRIGFRNISFPAPASRV
jgi:cyclopropane-fatty-acyl-phospholipid synthase